MLEVLGANRAVMYWFTYDDDGSQDWYVAEGEIRGNRILFPELLRVSGGQFGPGFDPDAVSRDVVGSARFIWSSCDSGAMEWVLDKQDSAPRRGRMNLRRLTVIMGLECGLASPQAAPEAAAMSGSWYDPTHSGEGYVLEVLADQRALVYWFSFDAEGLASLVMLDNLGFTTKIDFNNIKKNIEIDSTVFTFVPPAGVDVLGQ